MLQIKYKKSFDASIIETFTCPPEDRLFSYKHLLSKGYVIVGEA